MDRGEQRESDHPPVRVFDSRGERSARGTAGCGVLNVREKGMCGGKEKRRATHCALKSPLPLLPSGPGGVCRSESRRTRHCSSLPSQPASPRSAGTGPGAQPIGCPILCEAKGGLSCAARSAPSKRGKQHRVALRAMSHSCARSAHERGTRRSIENLSSPPPHKSFPYSNLHLPIISLENATIERVSK